MAIRQNGEFGIRSQVLSPVELVQSATINGAKLLGMEDELGQIVEGYIADMLILDANPLEDITVLSQIKQHCHGILKDGRVVFSTMSELARDEIYN